MRTRPSLESNRVVMIARRGQATCSAVIVGVAPYSSDHCRGKRQQQVCVLTRKCPALAEGAAFVDSIDLALSKSRQKFDLTQSGRPAGQDQPEVPPSRA